MDTVPTQRTVQRILRGGAQVDDVVNGRRPRNRAGIVLAPNSQWTHVPNELIQTIVDYSGPRGVPDELKAEAETYYLFLQHKSLRYVNPATQERVDFTSARRKWWSNFFVQVRNIKMRDAVDMRLELRTIETRLNLPRGQNAFTNEWLATQDSEDSLEYYDSASGVPAAFDGWFMQLYQEYQRPDVNCLQIDILIGEGDEAFDSEQLCMRHPAVRGVMRLLPRSSRSETSLFSCVFRKEQDQSRVSLLMYSPQFVAKTLQPKEPLFDATKWMREFLDADRAKGKRSGQISSRARAPEGECQLFPVRSHSLIPEVRDQELLRLQASREAWQYLIQSLIENQMPYAFEVIKLHLDPASHETRGIDTSDNLLSAERDAALHITVGEHDFSGNHLRDHGTDDVASDIDATVDPNQEWNTILINFRVDHNADTRYSPQEILQFKGILQFFVKFENLLRLSDEQISLVCTPLRGSWSYVTLMLYSPDFVLDCSDASITRADHLTATQELMQAMGDYF